MLEPPACPNCRRPIARMRLFWRSAWSRWRCPECDALIGVDTRRRLLAMFPWLGIVLLIVLVLGRAGAGVLVTVPILIAAAFATFFIVDRVVLIERRDVRCAACGYDLHDRRAGVCPECGAPFERDDDPLPAFTPSDDLDRALLRRRVTIALVLVLLGLLMLAGHLYLRAAMSRATNPPVPTATP